MLRIASKKTIIFSYLFCPNFSKILSRYKKGPETFAENVDIARAGGKVAGDARKAVEAQTGVPVITSQNAAQLNRVVTGMIEGVVTEQEDAEPDEKN